MTGNERKHRVLSPFVSERNSPPPKCRTHAYLHGIRASDSREETIVEASPSSCDRLCECGRRAIERGSGIEEGSFQVSSTVAGFLIFLSEYNYISHPPFALSAVLPSRAMLLPRSVECDERRVMST